MTTPTRRPPALLKAAAVLVALFALIGFVAAAGAGAPSKSKSNSKSADAGSAVDGGTAKRPRHYFPASKSAGGFYPDDEKKDDILGSSISDETSKAFKQKHDDMLDSGYFDRAPPKDTGIQY